MLVVCFLLQKMITVDVLAPGPEEEDGGLGLDVIWYKEHHRGETTDEKDKQKDRLICSHTNSTMLKK